MPLLDSTMFDGLEFKVPDKSDIEPSLKGHALTPKQYLDFIECSIKLLPEINAVRQSNMLGRPTVRFSL